jgi:hypothetical protein
VFESRAGTSLPGDNPAFSSLTLRCLLPQWEPYTTGYRLPGGPCKTGFP